MIYICSLYFYDIFLFSKKHLFLKQRITQRTANNPHAIKVTSTASSTLIQNRKSRINIKTPTKRKYIAKTQIYFTNFFISFF